MKAVVYSDAEGLRVDQHRKVPEPAADEALIKIRRAGICSTDLEIIKGYVPGFNYALGHEFVGEVAECSSQPELVGRRVCGEINCNCDKSFSHPDPIFARNHAPNRVVLGIIGKDGTMAEYVNLPVGNLHMVPDDINDEQACFVEPLAAACRIVEQQAVSQADKIAVIGDGKFGLLIAQNLVIAGHANVTHFGRHERKLRLVQGTKQQLVTDTTKADNAQAFDVCIEASGTPNGILLAVAMCRPLGTVVLKSTCSTVEGSSSEMPAWGAVANDIVVQELRLLGSRCGPFQPSIAALSDTRMKSLVGNMVEAVFPLDQGVEAITRAQQKGVLKVVIQP